MGPAFQIDFLDHVAMRVRDLDQTVKWYTRTLGLTVYQPEAWKPFPVMLLAGSSGIAVFPTLTENPQPLPDGDFVILSHFAFRVSLDAFEEAQKWFEQIGEPYRFEDHHPFHSVYLRDPDGHQVELTTLISV